jgi:hypothetical protein
VNDLSPKANLHTGNGRSVIDIYYSDLHGLYGRNPEQDRRKWRSVIAIYYFDLHGLYGRDPEQDRVITSQRPRNHERELALIHKRRRGPFGPTWPQSGQAGPLGSELTLQTKEIDRDLTLSKSNDFAW